MNQRQILSELRPFFYPRAVAVIGVSQDPTRFGSFMFRALKEFGYRHPIYPVSPRLTEFMGIQVYPSVTDIPAEVDLAYICLAAPLVPTTVKECRQKKVSAVIILSGGFSETGTAEGQKLEAELISLQGEGTRIIGPNCFGVYSPGGGVTQIPGIKYPREVGTVGLISQSGGNSEDFCQLCNDYGFHISKAVSYGNACDINETDLLQYFEADTDTAVISAYLEGLKNGREFFEVARRITAKKPLIVWKGGLTPSGARMVSSHTASLSGSNEIWPAFFQQTGAIQAKSLEELMDFTSAFNLLPPQTDNRVALVCGGGGVSVAASDASYHVGLTLPVLDEQVRQKLASVLPPVGTSSRNPVDVGTPFPPAEVLQNVLETLAGSGNVGSIIIDKIALSLKIRELLGYADQISWEDKPWIVDIPVQIRARFGIPVIVVLREVSGICNNVSAEIERRRLRGFYQAQGIPVYPNVERALKSLAQVVKYYTHVGSE